MSTPASSSGRSGDARSSSGLTATGRRFAYRPRPLRIASNPCSGRTLARGSSHFGPPTAPRSTASACCASSSVAGGSAEPVASMAAPPMSASRVSNVCPPALATASRTATASVVTSGPIPSPGRTQMSARMGPSPSSKKTSRKARARYRLGASDSTAWARRGASPDQATARCNRWRTGAPGARDAGDIRFRFSLRRESSAMNATTSLFGSLGLIPTGAALDAGRVAAAARAPRSRTGAEPRAAAG